MPIYAYKTRDERKGCRYCRQGFELLQRVNDNPLKKCPKCGAGVKRLISGFSLGFSKTGLDTKAKDKGFHKLKRVDKGKYEKLY
jgi:putative FmdB family regulatory protein